MKHLAIVLAAVLPATGCYRGECSRSIQVAWPTFRLADGTIATTCGGAAGVSTVDVWVDNGYAGTFACADGAAEVAVAHGSNLVTVEARDPSGVIRYRDELSVDGSSCGFQGTVQAEPGEGTVHVAYAFSPMNACFSNTIQSYMWVYVRDDVAGEIAADSSAAPEGFVCAEPGGSLSFRVAAGGYSLLRTEERIRGAAGYETVAADCGTYAFTVAAAAATTLTPTLVDTAVSCP